MSMSDDINPSLLVIVVDADFDAWAQRALNRIDTQVTYADMVSALIVFCNAYILMHRQNRLCILASHPGNGGCLQIYPRRDMPQIVNEEGGTNYQRDLQSGLTYDDFVPVAHLLPVILSEGLLQSTISRGIAAAQSNRMGSATDAESTPSPSLSKALSKGVCIINRQLQTLPKLQPRLLVMQVCNSFGFMYFVRSSCFVEIILQFCCRK